MIRFMPCPTADEVWNSLMAGNRRFVAGKPQARDLASLRHKLASGQSPKAIILSCSDSRVGPELIFDQSLGDLFVVRTAGNVADAVALGSIEYAVDHLHSYCVGRAWTPEVRCGECCVFRREDAESKLGRDRGKDSPSRESGEVLRQGR